MNLGEFLFESNKEILKDIFRVQANKYESDNSYVINKYYDGLNLVGVSIFRDEIDKRVICELHYWGKNKQVIVSMWRRILKDTRILQAAVFKNNERVINMLFRCGFEKIGENGLNNIYKKIL